MAKGTDLTGRKFGRLYVIQFGGYLGKKQERAWECVCDCGNTKVIRGYSLTAGNTSSCGCLALEVRRTHQKSGSLEYASWQAMKARCHSPNSNKYYMYGARGIYVCPEWLNSFESFYQDMGPRPSREHTIERLDGSKGYSPENCIWADKITQQNNMRTNRPITYHGETLNLSQWSRKLGVPATTLINRLGPRGLSVEQAFNYSPWQR